MAVKHGILGLLKQEDCHGYELQARFERLAESVWPVKPPQLYSTLERLEQGGLVSKERIEQEKRPDRNVYAITPSGEREFRRWLTSPTNTPRTLRDEFFLKATFALEDEPQLARELFINQRRALLNLVHQLQKVRSQADKSGNLRLKLLAKGAILHAEVDLKWLEDFEAVLVQREGR